MSSGFPGAGSPQTNKEVIDVCGPVSMGVASLVIGVASAIAQHMQTDAQMRSQNEYQKLQAEQYTKAARLNNQAAIQEYVEQSAAERIHQMQEQEATADAVAEQQKERLRNQGTMMASSNAAGVAMDLLMGDYARQEANNKERIRTQYANTAVNADTALVSYRNKAQNRINSQQDYVYTQHGSGAFAANTLGTALAIGGAGIKAWGAYEDAKSKIGKEV